MNKQIKQEESFKYRINFVIQGKLIYLSHLDLLQTFIRATRRANLPVALSKGFNPHAQLAFGPALPVGISSKNEYFDIILTKKIDPKKITEDFNQVLPKELAIKKTWQVPSNSKSLMAVFNCATYEIKFKNQTSEELIEAKEKLLKTKTWPVIRRRPKGDKTFDIRPGIWLVEFSNYQNKKNTDFYNILYMHVMIGNQGNVRPLEVAKALRINQDEIVNIERTGLYIKDAKGNYMDIENI